MQSVYNNNIKFIEITNFVDCDTDAPTLYAQPLPLALPLARHCLITALANGLRRNLFTQYIRIPRKGLHGRMMA